MDGQQENITKRILSIDQFRGFAILGMILVNYLGDFEAIPATFKHPRYGMTFANAIAPYFLLAVGMGFRMTFSRKVEKSGLQSAVFQSMKRYFILIFIGIVLYGPDFKQDIWDALVDIGFAGLLALPVILRSKAFRAMTAFLYLGVYQLLFIHTGYGEWTMDNSIDGGPLGPLSWTSILLFGTILYDLLLECSLKNFIRFSFISGVVLMVAGYCLSMLQPQTAWQFSQRSMSMAYPVFASGLSFITFLIFYIINDLYKLELPHLTILGMNPLLIYIVQNVLIELHGDFLPASAPVWQAVLGLIIIYSICYLIAHYLWRNKLIIKL